MLVLQVWLPPSASVMTVVTKFVPTAKVEPLTGVGGKGCDYGTRVAGYYQTAPTKPKPGGTI